MLIMTNDFIRFELLLNQVLSDSQWIYELSERAQVAGQANRF